MIGQQALSSDHKKPRPLSPDARAASQCQCSVALIGVNGPLSATMIGLSKMIQIVLQWLFKTIQLTQRLRVLCHRAVMLPGGPECYFINVTNISLQRDVEITHVWMDCSDELPVLNPLRPLPRRIKPEESWETWIAMNSLPQSVRDDGYDLARVRLSNGRIFKSKENKNIPGAGYVPGS